MKPKRWSEERLGRKQLPWERAASWNPWPRAKNHGYLSQKAERPKNEWIFSLEPPRHARKRLWSFDFSILKSPPGPITLNSNHCAAVDETFRVFVCWVDGLDVFSWWRHGAHPPTLMSIFLSPTQLPCRWQDIQIQGFKPFSPTPTPSMLNPSRIAHEPDQVSPKEDKLILWLKASVQLHCLARSPRDDLNSKFCRVE